MIDIPGAGKLNEWFGYWPTFHDAEVLSIHLDRGGPSRIRIHTWEMGDGVDAQGYGLRLKHVIVSLVFDAITGMELTGFNHQNVLWGVTFEPDEQGHRVVLEDIYGVGGHIAGRGMRIELEPCSETATATAPSS